MTKEYSVENCKFKFTCNKSWDEFKQTSIENIRHCGECNKDVHLVLTHKEFDSAIQNNYCIAVKNKHYTNSPMSVGMLDNFYRSSKE